MGGVMEFFFRQMGESSARYGRGRKESARSKRKAHAQPEAEDAGPTQAAGCFSGESGSTSGAMRARLVGALGHGDRPSLNRRTRSTTARRWAVWEIGQRHRDLGVLVSQGKRA